MSLKSIISKRLIALIMLTGAVGPSVRPALALTAVYVLKDVVFTASSVNGSPVQPPFTPPTAPMTGVFVWTYNAGDFANGSGTFTEIQIPWTCYGIGASLISSNGYGQYLSFAIDTASLNGTLAGPSAHSQGIDFQINLGPALSSPSRGTSVSSSGSSFDIWGNDGNECSGTNISGYIVPVQPSLSVQLLGTNGVISWPTNYADGFVLQTASSLSKGTLWSTSSITATITDTNCVVTNSVVAGGKVFFRLAR